MDCESHRRNNLVCDVAWRCIAGRGLWAVHWHWNFVVWCCSSNAIVRFGCFYRLKRLRLYLYLATHSEGGQVKIGPFLS